MVFSRDTQEYYKIIPFKISKRKHARRVKKNILFRCKVCKDLKDQNVNFV